MIAHAVFDPVGKERIVLRKTIILHLIKDTTPSSTKRNEKPISRRSFSSVYYANLCNR
jgi:hypothetical protein